jgi:hypothetical protein
MLHHHLSAFFLLVVVPALALSATLNREDLECRACYDIELSASNGMNIEYSRYMGTWQRIGLYDERPYYMCINDCQQLTDQLVGQSIFYSFYLMLYFTQIHLDLARGPVVGGRLPPRVQRGLWLRNAPHDPEHQGHQHLLSVRRPHHAVRLLQRSHYSRRRMHRMGPRRVGKVLLCLDVVLSWHVRLSDNLVISMSN